MSIFSRNHIKRLVVLFILLFPLSALSDESHATKIPFNGWFTLGVGGYLIDDNGYTFGQGGLIGLNIQANKHIFSLRSNAFVDTNIFDNIFDAFECGVVDTFGAEECINKTTEFRTIGLLYGRKTKNRILSIGIEKVHAKVKVSIKDTDTQQTTEFKRKLFSVAGLVMEAQYILPTNFIDISTHFIGNFNKERSFIGAAVSINLGNIK